MQCRVTQDRWVIVKSLTKHGPLEAEMQISPVLLPLELHEQYEKAKRHDTGRSAPPPPGQKVSNMLLEKSGRQLLIAPERQLYTGGYIQTSYQL